MPLYERIKFLAIFSSNLDEFFRVRVASLPALSNLQFTSPFKQDQDPADVLKSVLRIVDLQQRRFGTIFRRRIIPELQRTGIHLATNRKLTDRQLASVQTYFHSHVATHLLPIFPESKRAAPFLKNRSIYLVTVLRPNRSGYEQPANGPKDGREQVALVEIPSPPLPRFFLIPSNEPPYTILFLDDVIRLCLPEVFPDYTLKGTYAVKLTRDAELQIDDEFSGDLIEKIRKALSKRHLGLPSRFLYDPALPTSLLRFLQELLGLRDKDLVRGGRYHNFHDFMDFPNPLAPANTYEAMPPLVHAAFAQGGSVFDSVNNRDPLHSYPYQSFDPVLRFLAEAATDRFTSSLHITLYRTARQSRVIEQLIQAARNENQ